MDDSRGIDCGGPAGGSRAEETEVSAVWRREFWSDEAEYALTGIVGDVADMRGQVNQGRVDLFRVTGPGYAGFGITELRKQGADLVCMVHAYAGRGTRQAIADLRKLAAAAGCVRLLCSSQQPGIWKLHARNGWREYERHFAMDL